MMQDSQSPGRPGWLEASGLRHLFRTLSLTVHPAKLGIALLAIICTFVLGWLLDAVWIQASGGVDEGAIARFIAARELDQPYEEQTGEHGIFEVWREHERRCVLGLLGSSIPGASVAVGTPLGAYMEAHSRAQQVSQVQSLLRICRSSIYERPEQTAHALTIFRCVSFTAAD